MAIKSMRAYPGLRIVYRCNGYTGKPSDPIAWRAVILSVDGDRIFYDNANGFTQSWNKRMGPWKAIYAEHTNHLVVW